MTAEDKAPCEASQALSNAARFYADMACIYMVCRCCMVEAVCPCVQFNVPQGLLTMVANERGNDIVWHCQVTTDRHLYTGNGDCPHVAVLNVDHQMRLCGELLTYPRLP